MTTPDAVLAAVAADIGYVESPRGSNRTKYAAQAGHANGQPWCATFVVAKARQTGLPLPSESAYTPTMAAAFKAAGRWATNPQRGALAFFDFPDSTHRIQHIGWVESWTATTVTTIDGNTSATGSQDNGGAVLRRTRPRRYVVGYGLPAYAAQPPAPVPPRRVPAMFLSHPETGAVVYICTIGADNKVHYLPIEDPADRDRFLNAGWPLIEITDKTWKKWGGA